MMNKRKYQFGVRLMAIVMAVILMLPTIAFADTTTPVQTDGVVSSKTVTVNGDKATVSIEAYVTGETITTETTTPVDIVLVIDQSASMSQSMGSTTRQRAMQNAVTSFIDSVAEKNSATSQQKMAIVTFGNNATTVSNWTTVNASGATRLKNAVNALQVPSNAPTRVDNGMTRAQALMNSSDQTTGREKVVIVFTDGEPTTSNTFSTSVANNAIETAKSLKDSGVKIYTVGIFDGANPAQLYGSNYSYATYQSWDILQLFPSYVKVACDGSVNSRWGGAGYDGEADIPANNRFMNYLSNNYPDAQNLGVTRGNSPITYTITANYNRGEGSYFLAANDANALTNIFQTISNSIGQAAVSLDSTTVVRDIISECFTLPEGADANSIKISFVPCTDGVTEGTPTEAEGARANVNGKNVEITGFDFAKHYVPTSGTNAEGGKLRITFDIVIDQETARAGEVNTNGDASGLYKDGKLVESLQSGTATINSITWKGEDGTTLATKYIFKNGTVPAASEVTAPTVQNKTFKEWNTTKDNDGNITYTAVYERTVLNYTVDYMYDGKSIAPQTSGKVNAGDSVNISAPDIDGYEYANATLGGNAITDLTKVQVTANNNAIVLNYDKTIAYTVKYVDEDGKELAAATTDSKTISSGDTATVEVKAKDITNYTYDSAKNGSNAINDLKSVAVKDGDVITLTYKKTVLNYTVDYMYDGKSIAAQTSGKVNAGDSVSITAPAIDGYKYANATLGGNAISDLTKVQVTANNNAIVLNYDKTIAYTVKYVDDDGKELATATTDSKTISSGDTATVEVKTKDITNYTYDSAKNGSNAINDLKSVAVKDGDVITLTYKKTVLNYTVDYMYDGKSIAPQTSGNVNAGDSVNITAPTIDGYKYANATLGGNAITDLTKVQVTANNNAIVLNYNKAIAYTIKYVDEDGKEIANQTTDSKTISSGDTATVEVKTKDITNYTYDSAKNGSNAINDLKSVAVKDGDVITLTYKKTVLSYTVDYMYDGKSIAAQTSGNVNAGDSVNISAPDIDGYEYANATLGGNAISDLTKVQVTANNNAIVLNYNKTIAYTIKYVDEDSKEIASQTAESKTISSGDTATVEVKAKDIDNYTYDSAKNGSNAISDLKSVTVKDGDVITLTYKKTVLSYTVDYMYDGKSIAPQTSGKVNAGDSVNVTAPDIDGYKYANATLGGNAITDLTKVQVTANNNAIVLNYDKTIAYTVKYVDEDGNELATATTDSKTISSGDTATVEVKTKDITNYTYDSAKNGNTAISNLSSVTVKDGDVITLIYSRNPVDFTFRVIYVDENGATIKSTDKIGLKSKDGDTAVLTDITIPEIDGYTYSSNDFGLAESNGKLISDGRIVEDNEAIKLTYTQKTITYVINYVDEDGKTLRPEDHVTVASVDGVTGVMDDVTIPTMTGYVYLSNSLNLNQDGDKLQAQGTTVDDQDVLTLVFRPAEISYTVHYMKGNNEDSTVVLAATPSDDDVTVGLIGEDDVDIKTIAGYRYNRNTYVDADGNENELEKSADGTKLGLGTIRDGGDVYVHYSRRSGGNTDPDWALGKARLTKVDANDNSTTLAGAKFELYRADDDKLMGTYTTDSNGFIEATDLMGGNYYWKEIVPPGGYTIETGRINITVPVNGEQQVTVTNTKSEPPEVFSDEHDAYISGYPDGSVQPTGNITRAEVAMIFYRLLDKDVRADNEITTNRFNDVEADEWYNTAVSTIAKMGIISGYEDGSFRPNQTITRAEFAAIAARFDSNSIDAAANFTDLDGHWAAIEIAKATNRGWVSGYEDGSFRPNKTITRAESISLVNRVTQRLPETIDDLSRDMLTFWDNTNTNTWYYIAVQEAANGHEYERKTNGYEYWIALQN